MEYVVNNKHKSVYIKDCTVNRKVNLSINKLKLDINLYSGCCKIIDKKIKELADYKEKSVDIDYDSINGYYVIDDKIGFKNITYILGTLGSNRKKDLDKMFSFNYDYDNNKHKSR